MANLGGSSYLQLKNPNASSNDDDDATQFLQAQAAAGSLPTLPVPTQGPTTLQNPIMMNDTPKIGLDPTILGKANKASDTQTQQAGQKTKTMFSNPEWQQIISQAMSSQPIQDQKQAIDDQDARAQAYADKMAGKDTNNYSALGAMADNLNAIGGQKTDYASALEKLASQNDPKKIQDEVLKNFADVTKARKDLGTETLNATKDMQSGDVSNKLVDAQMQGIQAMNPAMIQNRQTRMFEQQRDALLNDPQTKAIASSIRSLGTGMNQLGSGQILPANIPAELTNIANVVAGAGAGMSAGERAEMGVDNIGMDLTKLQSYLVGPQSVPGGLNNPVVKQLIDRVNSENEALGQYLQRRVMTRVNNNKPLYDMDPRFEPAMRSTANEMIASVAPTQQAQNIGQKFGNQGASLASTQTPSGSSRTPVGTVEGGYRFKGGDDTKQENWEPVK